MLEKMIKNLEKRSRNTETAKKLIFDIISGINEHIPEGVNIRGENIECQFEKIFSDGSYCQFSTEEDTLVELAVKNGYLRIYHIDIYDFSNSERLGIDEIRHINIADFNSALGYIIEKLENVETFEEETKEIKEIMEALR